MESTGGSIRQGGPQRRAWTKLLFYVTLLGSTGHLNSRAWGQEACGVTRTTPLQVEDETGVDTLRAATNCTGGGSLEADWVGAITLDTPISIASGMFLFITGEDTLAEVRGGNQTRMFQVAPGGGLILTQLTLSGGTFEGSGGAIYSKSASLTLASCIFQGNVATDGDGGAVWAEGGNVTIIGGEFLGNSASVYGGAVAATGVSSLVVEAGSTFEGNQALVGGALYCSGVAESGLLARCSLSDTEFRSNAATGESEELLLFNDPSEGVDGGGAVALLFASANITDSVFGGNTAQFSGGALLGGNGTDITVNGCTFENNTAVENGGAIAAATMILGGNTLLSNNSADGDGGAVLGWDPNGAIIFNDVTCNRNTAIDEGGCFRGVGKDVVNDGTIMHNNGATHGGCMYAHDGSELKVVGGDFMCESRRKAGALLLGDDTFVTITGGLFANNVGGDRGGAVYCTGNGHSIFTIEGGTFRGNTAGEYGGAVSAWGLDTVVQVTGGTFTNNTAKFNGGFFYLDGVGNFTCEGAYVNGNYAGDQGGAIYSGGSTWMNSSCDLMDNQAPQGGSLYLTSVHSVTLQNLTISNDLALGGGMLYMTESSVVATGVTFKSGVVVQEDSPNRAVQSDSNSVFTAKECVFDGWLGDTVIYHRSSDADSLSLDSCDFSGSSAITAAFSLNSDAKIRNAVVGDLTFANEVRLNNSLLLVNRALDCSSPNICGPGDCVDSTLGVLCECLDIDACLDDGGGLSLTIKTPPAKETLSPDQVSFELLVSSAGDGTTYAIWDLAFEAEDLNVDVAPSSGVLPSGGSITVVVTGTAASQGVRGNLTSSFNLTSVGSASSTPTAGVTLKVDSAYYLCSAFNYADPLAGDVNNFSCEPCISISGGEGVDCNSAGATLASLPLRQGYWRSDQESLVVHKCGLLEACAGATDVLSADDYCASGYQGPYCAVCSEGYGRGVGNICHSCDNTHGQRFIWAGVIAFVVVLLLVVMLALVFLVGGLAAVTTVHKSVTQTVPAARRAPKVGAVSLRSMQELDHPERRSRKEYSVDTKMPPASDYIWESQQGAGERDIGHSSRESPPTNPGLDGTGKTLVRPSSAVGSPGDKAARSDVPARHGSSVGMPAGHHVRPSTVISRAVGGAETTERKGLRTTDGGESKCCCLGVDMKRLRSRLPLNQLKILVVVWQILSVFSSITEVEFPESYSTFLSWIDVVNFDIAHIFSASCTLPSVNFYTSLLVTTLTPLALGAVLLLTYHLAKRRAGIGAAGVDARRAALSRHVAAGLFLSFLVFTSTSTLVFKTFACDDTVSEGKSYLRADYSLLCESGWHRFFKGYAILMILVYPIGIPAMYAAILWRNRELLNPRIHTAVMPEPEEPSGTPIVVADSAESAGIASLVRRVASKAQTGTKLSPQELKELAERVAARRDNPELTSSMFLWKDFGPALYYYEVLECGRRILLTGVLIFISPDGSTRVAAACVFAFGTLLGFELLRPHLDATDAWLYRMGCVVIFLSYFLALLIDVDSAGEDGRSALADLLVAINVVLVLVTFLAPWFMARPSPPTKQSAISPGGEELSLTSANA